MRGAAFFQLALRLRTHLVPRFLYKDSLVKSYMKAPRSQTTHQFRRHRYVNAVALQNAVLCADCEMVSDSSHDSCLVCGSRSLFNIAGIVGGALHNRESQRTEGGLTEEYGFWRKWVYFPGIIARD